MGRQPPIVRILQEMRAKMQAISLETGFPCILVATCVDADDLPGEVSACFKQNLMVQVNDASPNGTDGHRLRMSRSALPCSRPYFIRSEYPPTYSSRTWQLSPLHFFPPTSRRSFYTPRT